MNRLYSIILLVLCFNGYQVYGSQPSEGDKKSKKEGAASSAEHGLTAETEQRIIAQSLAAAGTALSPAVQQKDQKNSHDALVGRLVFKRDVEDSMSRPKKYETDVDPELADFILKNCPEAVQEVADLLDATEFEDEFFPRRLLLIGPAGAGKSTIAEALGIKNKLETLPYRAGLIADQFKKSGNKNLEFIFEEAIAKNKPCIVIIDELQDLVKAHNNTNDSDFQMMSALWAQLDLIAKKNKILFIGILNYVEDIPEPISSRFGGYVAWMKMPDKSQRLKVLNFYKENKKGATFDKSIDWANLAELTDGRSNRDLAQIVHKGVVKAKLRARKSTAKISATVTMNDLLHAAHLFKKEQANLYPNRSLGFKLKKAAMDIAPYAFALASGVLIAKFSHYLQSGNHAESMEAQRQMKALQIRQHQDNIALASSSNRMAAMQLMATAESLNLQRASIGKQNTANTLGTINTIMQVGSLVLNRL